MNPILNPVGVASAFGGWFGNQISGEIGERISDAVEVMALGFFAVAM